MNKISVDPIVIVEGKYDKITLSNVIDATIIPCNGFEIFKDEEQKNIIRKLAKDRGAIILTDSDRSGAQIRSYLQTILQNAPVNVLLVPAIRGKEKRKASYSKEGLLGVEGMSSELLRSLFENFSSAPIPNNIVSSDLFDLGISGREGAKEKREDLLRDLNLPQHISKNLLLRELNRRFSRDEFYAYMKTKK
jgi:ribonuclease M5